MLTVGTDSYVTVSDADEYIAGHRPSANPARTRWAGLSTEDKEILLRQACGEIERLPMLGRKYVLDQLMQFPRVRFSDYRPPPDCPEEVKAAQIELALWLSDDGEQAAQDKRAALQAQGVSSYGIGNLSETFVLGRMELPAPLRCPRAAALLARWVNGGTRTC